MARAKQGGIWPSKYGVTPSGTGSVTLLHRFKYPHGQWYVTYHFDEVDGRVVHRS
jgi:hypothetical protein